MELDQKDKYDSMRPWSTHGTRDFKEHGEVSGILGGGGRGSSIHSRRGRERQGSHRQAVVQTRERREKYRGYRQGAFSVVQIQWVVAQVVNM